jgi:hypothetical protein
VNRFFDSAKTVSRFPALEYEYKLSTYFRQKDKTSYVLEPSEAAKTMASFADSYRRIDLHRLGFAAVGNTLYGHFERRTGGREGSMQHFVQGIAGVSERGVRDMLFDAANAYVLPEATHVTGAPVDSSGFLIEDETVPFYQLALRDLVGLSTPPVNLAANVTELFLKAVETGSSVQYSWIYSDISAVKETDMDYLYSADYRYWVDTAVRQYEALSVLWEQTGDADIEAHTILGAGLRETRYDNGVRVIVNYDDREAFVEGRRVMPGGFLVIDGRAES